MTRRVLTRRLFIIALMLGLCLGGCEKPDVSVRCPVMETRKYEKTFFVDYQGKRYFVCCESCKVLFKREPQKYTRKIEQWQVSANGVALLEEAQKNE